MKTVIIKIIRNEELMRDHLLRGNGIQNKIMLIKGIGMAIKKVTKRAMTMFQVVLIVTVILLPHHHHLPHQTVLIKVNRSR